MSEQQSLFPPQRPPRPTVAAKIGEYDRKNLELARQVLADPQNPKYAHLVEIARRTVSRLEGDRGPL